MSPVRSIQPVTFPVSERVGFGVAAAGEIAAIKMRAAVTPGALVEHAVVDDQTLGVRADVMGKGPRDSIGIDRDRGLS